MATTISNLTEAQVDESVIAGLRLALPMLSAFSYKIDAGEAIKNNVTRVPLAVDPTEGAKTAGTLISGSGSLTGVDVTLDQFRGAGWDAKEGEVSAIQLPTYWADKLKGAAYVSVKRAVDQVLSLITAANFGNTSADKYTVAAADFGQDDAANLWALAETKIMNQEKAFLMNTSYAAALFGTSSLANVYAANGNNFLESGKLPRFLSLNQMYYPAFPNNGENLGGAVIGRGALAVAFARPSMLMQAGEGNIVERRVITDPDTGLSLLYTVTADGGGTMAGEVCLLYGYAKAQNAVVRLCTA